MPFHHDDYHLIPTIIGALSSLKDKEKLNSFLNQLTVDEMRFLITPIEGGVSYQIPYRNSNDYPTHFHYLMDMGVTEIMEIIKKFEKRLIQKKSSNVRALDQIALLKDSRNSSFIDYFFGYSIEQATHIYSFLSDSVVNEYALDINEYALDINKNGSFSILNKFYNEQHRDTYGNTGFNRGIYSFISRLSDQTFYKLMLKKYNIRGLDMLYLANCQPFFHRIPDEIIFEKLCGDGNYKYETLFINWVRKGENDSLKFSLKFLTTSIFNILRLDPHNKAIEAYNYELSCHCGYVCYCNNKRHCSKEIIDAIVKANKFVRNPEQAVKDNPKEFLDFVNKNLASIKKDMPDIKFWVSLLKAGINHCEVESIRDHLLIKKINLQLKYYFLNNTSDVQFLIDGYLSIHQIICPEKLSVEDRLFLGKTLFDFSRNIKSMPSELQFLISKENDKFEETKKGLKLLKPILEMDLKDSIHENEQYLFKAICSQKDEKLSTTLSIQNPKDLYNDNMMLLSNQSDALEKIGWHYFSILFRSLPYDFSENNKKVMLQLAKYKLMFEENLNPENITNIQKIIANEINRTKPIQKYTFCCFKIKDPYFRWLENTNDALNKVLHSIEKKNKPAFN